MIELTFPWNVTGSPALALPCGPAEDGLPASVQLIGRPGDDALVLAAGRALSGRVGQPVVVDLDGAEHRRPCADELLGTLLAEYASADRGRERQAWRGRIGRTVERRADAVAAEPVRPPRPSTSRQRRERRR